MTQGWEEARAAPKEMPPIGSKMNWWGVLGLLCVISSALLSVAILEEVISFLQAGGLSGMRLPLP